MYSDIYSGSLICWTLSSSVEAFGVRGLAQGHLSGADENGASAAFHSPPHQIYPAGPGDLKQRPSGHELASLTFTAAPGIDFPLQRRLLGLDLQLDPGEPNPQTS